MRWCWRGPRTREVRLDSDLTACAELVRKGDPERFLAAMAAPVAARQVLFPIYAFNVEVARAPWVTAEPIIAEMRLQWWRDVLEEIRGGGPVRRHEVATPLAAVLDADGAALLDALVAARRWDCYRDPYADEAHFADYIEKTSANLLLAAAGALGDVPVAPLKAAGRAMGLANWLRAVPALEQAGRIPLVDGTPGGVRALAREGLEALATARAARDMVQRQVRPVLLSGWKTGVILRRAAADPARVAGGALDIAPMRSRLMLMARAATGRW